MISEKKVGEKIKMPYIVVFEYNEGVKTIGVSLAGFRFYESFENKETFDNYYTDEVKQKQKVIADGVTEIEADRRKRRLENITDKPLIKEINPNLFQDNSIKDE